MAGGQDKGLSRRANRAFVPLFLRRFFSFPEFSPKNENDLALSVYFYSAGLIPRAPIPNEEA
jgi:hypothetical protein